MSISNLLVPNDLDIFCNTITANTEGVGGKLQVTNNTPNGTNNINVNQTAPSSANDIGFSTSGVDHFYVGHNPNANEAYLLTTDCPLKFLTSGVERMRIDATGISNNNGAVNILGLSPGGDSLVYRNNLISPGDLSDYVTLDTTQTITGSKTFNGITVNGQIVENVSVPHSLVVNNTSTTFSNELLIENNGTSMVGFGNNNTSNESYVWVYANQPLKFATNSSERLRILSSGIPNDNTITTTILGLQGTTLSYKNNVVDTNTIQTLSNKSLDTGSNILTVTSSPLSSANINSLINQALTTTSNPIFNNIQINGYRVSDILTAQPINIYNSSINPLNYSYAIRTSIAAAASNIVIWSYSLVQNYSITIDFYGTGFNSANGSGSYHFSNNFRQTSSVVTNTGTLYTDKKETAGVYSNKLAITFSNSGTTLQLLVSNSEAFPISLSGVINTYLTF